MLKLLGSVFCWVNPLQPPSGGCVLKQVICCWCRRSFGQPPSGGCVLKPLGKVSVFAASSPAAFRRLCVETAFSFVPIMR